MKTLNFPGILSCPQYTAIVDRLIRLCFTVMVFVAGLGMVSGACLPVPDGLVGWWQGEVSAGDLTGTNNGTLVGNVGYASARVNQGFVFDVAGDGVQLANHSSLQLQNLTIEAWIRRSNTNIASYAVGGHGVIFAYGWGGYFFWMQGSGSLGFNRLGDVAPLNGPAITDTAWHHVAVAKSGTTVTFYLDGQAFPAPTYTGTFTFTTPAGIGYRPDDGDYSFLGSIDEVSIYNRGLSSNEVQAIYAAGSYGKCFTPSAPQLFTQPADKTVYAGSPVDFSVSAGGTPPLSYQWRLEGTNLVGATSSALVIPLVQAESAGNYSVVVSNSVGTVASSNALLTVLPLPPCLPVPSGIAGWWRGDGDASDQATGLATALIGNVSYGPGRVGDGFVLDGNGDGILLGNPVSLQLQDLTFETWIRRSSAAGVSAESPGNAVLLSSGWGGYFFWVESNGLLHFNALGDYATLNGPSITDTNWHHVAVTKSGTAVTFYLDGQAYPAPAYSGSFSFPSEIGIGFRADSRNNSFLGTIDEPAIYSRGLTVSEIQAIYAVGSSGKCFTPVAPNIVYQPASRTAHVGDSVDFSVVAGGTSPLYYQWRLEGTNLARATGSTLVLPLVQTESAGDYSVVVSNSVGTATSSNALLTVLPAPPCQAVAEGLVAWWRGQGDLIDQVGGISASPVGNAGYGLGRVGQGFVFDGNGDGISLGNPANLQLQNLTIEAWIKRGSASAASATGAGNAVIFGYGWGGYFYWMESNGVLHFNRLGDYAALNGPSITDTNWHHVAITKSGTAVTFFLDGQAFPAPTYTGTFTFTTPAGFGFRADGRVDSFLGKIDEVSVYNRGLTANEIQAIYAAASGGKCATTFPVFVVTPPASQTATVGSTATLSVVAGGTPPFTYQWTRNGTNLPGATASSMVISSVEFGDAGIYAAVVSNAVNSATSSSAQLSVVFPPATVRVAAVSGMGGGPVTVPIEVVANGNENALQFSLSYNASLLSFAGASLGTNFSDATLFVNTNQVGSGRVGLILALPTDTTMTNGLHQVILVTFSTAVRSSSTSTAISFGDSPTVRQLVDAQAATLSANYASGNVSLSATILEGDSSPRPNGDRAVTVSDWVLLGRYAARLDYPTNASEFQRADCAPRSTLGDGAIKVTDWVQVGRYTGAADPLTVVGGPTGEVPGGGSGGSIAKDGSDRSLVVVNTTWFTGQTGVVSIMLKGTGHESALGFSLAFDPTRISFVSAGKGAGSGNATLNVNSTQVASGKLGVALGLNSGSFPAGANELVKLNLRSLSGATTGTTAIGFGDLPVPREISDSAALPLATAYENGSVTVHPFPVLRIAADVGEVMLTWPGWATNFTLQASGSLETGGWTNCSATPALINGEFRLRLPAEASALFYRLSQP